MHLPRRRLVVPGRDAQSVYLRNARDRDQVVIVEPRFLPGVDQPILCVNLQHTTFRHLSDECLHYAENFAKHHGELNMLTATPTYGHVDTTERHGLIVVAQPPKVGDVLRLRFRPWLRNAEEFDIESAVIPSIKYGRIEKVSPNL